MSKLTLRKAVERLHKDGDPIAVAIIRIRRAVAAREILTYGLLVGREQWGEWFEAEQFVNPYHWEIAAKIDWEQSTIEAATPYEIDENDEIWMYYSRITLDPEAFDRVFFPDKAKPSDDKQLIEPKRPPIAISEVKSWLDREYGDKPRPGVHELRAAAKTYDSRVTRTLLEFAAAEKWPEPRRRGRPSGADNVQKKCAGKVQE